LAHAQGLLAGANRPADGRVVKSGPMPGTVLTVSTRALLDSCVRLGLDTAALLAAADIDRALVDNPDGRLPRAKMAELWRLAYAASGDANLALHAAEELRFGAYRVIDYLGMAAPTVGEAITQVSAYFPIINSVVRLPITDHDAEVRVAITSPDDPEALSRAYVEYTFAAVFLRVREATGVPFPLAHVELAFPARASTAEHRRIFACPVRFGAEQSAMHLARATWATPSTRGDPDLFGVLADHARLIERQVPTEPPPVLDARRAIAAQLKGGPPSLERTAKQLAMSPRTLQRRLAEHGHRYADLLDSTRAGAALSYLSDRQISLAEVAYLLGFAEQSSFNHAFRRWTGKAPSEYRKSA
jgi:AraC-like DNA-binding protein